MGIPEIKVILEDDLKDLLKDISYRKEIPIPNVIDKYISTTIKRDFNKGYQIGYFIDITLDFYKSNKETLSRQEQWKVSLEKANRSKGEPFKQVKLSFAFIC